MRERGAFPSEPTNLNPHTGRFMDAGVAIKHRGAPIGAPRLIGNN